MKDDNVVSPEKFNPPTELEAIYDGKGSGSCFVYDAASWRNRNRRNSQRGPNSESKVVPVRRKEKVA